MPSGASYPLFHSADIINKYGIGDTLESYLDRLMEYNKKLNLVSRETTWEALRRVAADCLMPFEFTSPPVDGDSFFDIGSGGGFPSIIHLLSFSGFEGTLYERVQKKAGFLISTITHFNLSAQVCPESFSLKSMPGKASFDIGFMKLVKLNNGILSNALSALKPNGRFIYYSSVSDLENLNNDRYNIEIFSYYLDDPKQLRFVTVFSKP